jgi:hypothetical protein
MVYNQMGKEEDEFKRAQIVKNLNHLVDREIEASVQEFRDR